MGKSDNQISPSTEGAPRPNLFGSGATAGEHNIFDSMAVRESASPAAKPRRLAWLLVPLLAAAAWGAATRLHKQAQTGPVAQTVSIAAPPALPTPVPPSPVPTAPAKNEALGAGDPFSTLHAPQVANAPAPAPTPKPTAIQTAPAFDMQAALEKPATASPKEGKAPSERDTVAKQNQKPATKTTESKPATPKTTVAKATVPSDSKTTAKAVAPAPKKTNGADPDVELLSAIMKHLGDERGATGGTARSSQTIAELVKSCRTNDPIETLLCQRRICEGSWGKAQACPQNLAPKQTAKAVATPAPQ